MQMFSPAFLHQFNNQRFILFLDREALQMFVADLFLIRFGCAFLGEMKLNLFR